MKILIGEISSYKAIVICKFIKTHYKNISIFSYDTKKFSKYLVSKYTDKHFLINSDTLEDELRQIIASNKIDYFFPVINDNLTRLWKKKTLFANTLGYLGNIDTYNILNDKVLLHVLATTLGLKVPVRYDSLVDAKFPYVVKPKNSSSAKGVVYVNSEKDIPQNLHYNNLIIQQYIKGIGVGFSFYCKNGVILNGYGHKRLTEYPVSGGSSTYREGFQNNKMIEIASKIVERLKYNGFAMFEYKLTPENEIYLIEVNPRIWGSINQGLANGINYFEGILGKADQFIEKRKKEKKTFLSPLFYLSIIKYAIRFEFQPIIYFLKNVWNNSQDVCLFNDPKGYLSMLLRKL